MTTGLDKSALFERIWGLNAQIFLHQNILQNKRHPHFPLPFCHEVSIVGQVFSVYIPQEPSEVSFILLSKWAVLYNTQNL